VGRRLGIHHSGCNAAIERRWPLAPPGGTDDGAATGGRSLDHAREGQGLAGIAGRRQGKDNGYTLRGCGRRRLLARHARRAGRLQARPFGPSDVQGTLCKILGKEKIKRTRCATLLRTATELNRDGRRSVRYRESEVLKKLLTNRTGGEAGGDRLCAMKSQESKPSQPRTPDLPRRTTVSATFARDNEDKPMARSGRGRKDMLPAKVLARRRSHRSREFVECSELLDTAYPAGTAQQVDPHYIPRLYRKNPLGRQSTARTVELTFTQAR